MEEEEGSRERKKERASKRDGSGKEEKKSGEGGEIQDNEMKQY
jgi:hypothetical protein